MQLVEDDQLEVEVEQADAMIKRINCAIISDVLAGLT